LNFELLSPDQQALRSCNHGVTVLIVHGGAGKWQEALLGSAREGLHEALMAGYDALRRTGSSIESVLAAVRVMEDNPLFNCGKGSALTIDGRIQMDAALMTSDGRFGAVAAIENVQHPIDVACKVMTETSHLIIAGSGATQLARLWGFPRFNPMTEKAKRQLAELKARSRPETGDGENSVQSSNCKVQSAKCKVCSLQFAVCSDWVLGLRSSPHKFGTVGAVALDRYGRIAVANSTGGTRGKLPGRVGDTPIYGAGTFASRYGGVTGTGIGEELIRLFLGKTVCDLMAKHSAQRAVDIGLKPARHAGLIAIDRQGEVGIGYTTAHMPWAYIRDGVEKQFQDMSNIKYQIADVRTSGLS
jgi:beta-aspartyl-peptidase (threonine type)